jgi:glutamate formiminotransferase
LVSLLAQLFLLNPQTRMALRTLIECVPNFSEGRDPRKIEQIQAAVQAVPGAYLLDSHVDPDHHRTVLTFAGDISAVREAAVSAVAAASRLIDLNQHRGEHPRIGAADVVPFVPLEGVVLEDCIAIARQAGEEIYQRCGVPVYYYGQAALRPERRKLANLRRGGFEGLRERVRDDPALRPDVGGPLLHPTAGATAVGARQALIAFNIQLHSGDKSIAERIARSVRESSGGLPAVQAIGTLLRSRSDAGSTGIAQVSMNLTDFHRTSLLETYQAVEHAAARFGVSVAGSEIVGLVPALALSHVQPESLKLANFRPGIILENRLAEVLPKQ